jgi:hypothetical protein
MQEIPDGVNKARLRGIRDAFQDRCENIPCVSIGGLENRTNMKAPDYISEKDYDEYLKGYEQQCEEMWGNDWKTCKFSWSLALVSGGENR